MTQNGIQHLLKYLESACVKLKTMTSACSHTGEDLRITSWELIRVPGLTFWHHSPKLLVIGFAIEGALVLISLHLSTEIAPQKLSVDAFCQTSEKFEHLDWKKHSIKAYMSTSGVCLPQVKNTFHLNPPSISVQLFSCNCAGVSLLVSSKRNMAQYNWTCLYGYKLTAPVKKTKKKTTCYLTVFRDLLGSSGGVNSLDFCPASLQILGCFYFWCILSSQWLAVTVDLGILHCQL